MSTRSLAVPHVVSLAGLALAAACDGVPVMPPQPDHHMPVAARSAAELSPSARQQLAELRAATARFHDRDAAAAAGFTAQLTGCMSDPALGAMGVHVGDLTRFDADAVHDAPEILMYEPQRDGRLRFVGLEFAVPFDAWTAAEPPALFGQSFRRNETFGLWVLHVWTGRENPSGMFADWNPRVSCDGS